MQILRGHYYHLCYEDMKSWSTLCYNLFFFFLYITKKNSQKQYSFSIQNDVKFSTEILLKWFLGNICISSLSLDDGNKNFTYQKMCIREYRDILLWPERNPPTSNQKEKNWKWGSCSPCHQPLTKAVQNSVQMNTKVRTSLFCEQKDQYPYTKGL